MDSFCAQSGRTLSVVTTVGAVAESDVVLRREVDVGERCPALPVADTREEEEDIAEVALAKGWVDDWLT